MTHRTKSEPTAIERAYEMLSRSDYSTARLTEKLIRKGHSEEAAKAAVDELVARRLMNDRELCAHRLSAMYDEGRVSVRQIVEKLMIQGFPREMILECLPEETEERELAAATRALRTKFKKGADHRKMGAYLYRKGFGGSICHTAVGNFLSEGGGSLEA